MTRSTWLLGLVALLGCLSPSWADTTTLAIPTVLIKLTIKKLRGGRNLLRGQEQEQYQLQQPQSANQLLDEGRRLQSIDSTVQSVAERHLSSVYADAFSLPPDQVLLTVVTDEDDEDGGSAGGIYVRSSFLGGVVTFPANRAQSPSRSQLEEVTVAAFKVPGAAGEDFLEALIDTDHPELAGLLLVDASSVTRPSDATEGAEGVAVQHDDGSSSSGGTSMNIWAVAAVAALGAMFLVIVLCTSILYCDWRKRRDRRERKRDRAVAVASANHHHHNGKGYNRMNSKKSSNKSYKADEDGIEVVAPFETELTQPALQIVVPSGSGETEEINTPSPKSNGDKEFNPDPTNVSGTPEKKGLMGKLKSSRRGLGSKVVKSKAVERQLQDAQSPPSSSSNHHLNSPASPSVGYQMSEDEFGLPGAAQSIADYSVGEDTTMLYPSVNRGRTTSRDNESEFDGYSMDGMSAIGDGMGLSQYGGSAGGSGTGTSARKGGRDVYYSGEVPRDFDSVWGDDDQSKITMGDTSLDLNDTVNDTNKKAYGDLTKNLDELVELGESEERSGKGSNSVVSSSAGGETSSSVGINLHDFDSESESGSHRANFTLELLGGGKGARATMSAAGSAADDEDSILGGMYQDEASSVGLGAGSSEGGDAGGKVPGSGDSVDSTPSWAAPIQNALSRSMDIFRASPEKAAREEKDEEEEEAASIARKDTDKDADDASTSEQSIEERTKEKLLSSIHGSDDASVGSNRSGRSNSSKSSASSRGSRGSKSKRDRTTAQSAKDKALGLTNSMEEEVDEDPAAMIDNINSMLSECREILDTDETPAEKV